MFDNLQSANKAFAHYRGARLHKNGLLYSIDSQNVNFINSYDIVYECNAMFLPDGAFMPKYYQLTDYWYCTPLYRFEINVPYLKELQTLHSKHLHNLYNPHCNLPELYKFAELVSKTINETLGMALDTIINVASNGSDSLQLTFNYSTVRMHMGKTILFDVVSDRRNKTKITQMQRKIEFS